VRTAVFLAFGQPVSGLRMNVTPIRAATKMVRWGYFTAFRDTQVSYENFWQAGSGFGRNEPDL